MNGPSLVTQYLRWESCSHLKAEEATGPLGPMGAQPWQKAGGDWRERLQIQGIPWDLSLPYLPPLRS